MSKRFLDWIVLLLGILWVGSPGPAHGGASTRLSVVMESRGAFLREVERYVAVVPEDRPWWEPTAEILLRPGDSDPVFSVSPGRYRVVCSALGYSVAYDRTKDLQPGTERHHCELVALAQVAGRIASARTERPVAGARLGYASLFQHDSRRRLTATGESHLRRNFIAVSGADGSFQLPVIPEHRSNFWVEAPGFEPAFLPQVLPSVSQREYEIFLRPGGSLRLHLEIPSGFPAEKYRVLLRPVGRWSHRNRIPLEHWTRPLVDLDRGSVWLSLPVGDFEVWLKGSPFGAHEDLPWRLGVTRVEEGQETLFQAQIPVLRGGSTEPVRTHPQGSESPPDLRLLLRDLEIEQPRQLRVFAWQGDAAKPIEAEPLVASGGTVVRFPEGCVPGYTYLVSTSDWISRLLRVDEADCRETSVAVEMVPAARLEGALEAAVGHPLPETGKVVLRSCSGTSGQSVAFLGKLPLNIDDKGRWSVPVPAGCLETTLEVPPFAAVTWPGISVEAGEKLDLGTTALERGAAILVQIQAAETGRPLPGARVEVVPAAELTRVATALVQGRRVALAQGKTTEERGWVRLAGLAPGRVHLRVSSPGRAAAISPAIELEPGVEWVSDPLAIGFPASLSVEVVGTADVGDGLEVQVALKPELVCGVSPPTQLSEALEPGGVAEFTRLVPGRWSLEVQVATEIGLAHTVTQRHLELAPGTHSLEVIEIENKVFSGRVTYRGDPVRADLSFDREIGIDSFGRARTESKADGTFRVLLAEPGEYTVHVRDLDGGLPGAVMVPGNSFQDPAETVLIELPEGRLEGVVTGADGLPAAEAWVTAFRYDPSERRESERRRPILRAGVPSDDRGEFRFEAVPPGHWNLEAHHGELRSRPVSEEMEEDEEVTGIRLRLTYGRKVSGRITTGLGLPVARARGVVEIAPRSVDGTGDRESFTTDEDGRFEVTVHEEVSSRANITVFARHLPLALFRAPVARDLELEIPELGGGLDLVAPAGEGAWSSGDLSRLFLVTEDGAAVQLVEAAAPRHGGMIVTEAPAHLVSVPSLTPGAWRLIFIADRRAMIGLFQGKPAGKVLASLVSRAGATVRLELPAP